MVTGESIARQVVRELWGIILYPKLAKIKTVLYL